MPLPGFLIIGAAKSGTTTLHQYLSRHPQVYMSVPKEPEFFAKDENYAKGIEWYASIFSKAEPDQVCGESSNIYTISPQFPNSAERIAKTLPHVKMIYIMRHPVNRAYSHYLQKIENAQCKRNLLEGGESFEERIKRDSLILDCSDYMMQIEQYLKFFPRESFLFILMNDLIKQTEETLCNVFKFIGVDQIIYPFPEKEIVANRALEHSSGWFIRERITAHLKAIPGIARAASLLPQEMRDQFYHQVLKKLPYSKRVEKKYLPQPMRPETRQMLLARFRESNQRLAEFLNRDLSHWDR
jgi:hypothetical protein